MAKAQTSALLDEGDITITETSITTPDEEYPLAPVTAFDRRTAKPFVVPIVLAVLGTINAVIAVQTMFWGDFLACAVMIGGGLWWRGRGTRHLLRIVRGGSPEVVWQTRDAERMQRVVACLEKLGKQRNA